MIKKSIQEEDLTIIYIYIYAPNIGGPEHTRQMLTTIKREINNSKAVMVGDFYIPLMPMDRASIKGSFKLVSLVVQTVKNLPAMQETQV